MSNSLLSDLTKRVKRFGKSPNIVPGTYMSAAGIQTEIHPTTLARLAVHETKYRRLIHVYRQDLENTVFQIRRDQRLLRKSVADYQTKWKYNQMHRRVTSSIIRRDNESEINSSKTKRRSKSEKKVRILLPLENSPSKVMPMKNNWTKDEKFGKVKNPLPPVEEKFNSNSSTNMKGRIDYNTDKTEKSKCLPQHDGNALTSSAFSNIIEKSTLPSITNQDDTEQSINDVNSKHSTAPQSVPTKKTSASNLKAVDKLLNNDKSRQHAYLTPVGTPLSSKSEVPFMMATKEPLPAIKNTEYNHDTVVSSAEYRSSDASNSNVLIRETHIEENIVHPKRGRKKGTVEIPFIEVEAMQEDHTFAGRPKKYSVDETDHTNENQNVLLHPDHKTKDFPQTDNVKTKEQPRRTSIIKLVQNRNEQTLDGKNNSKRTVIFLDEYHNEQRDENELNYNDTDENYSEETASGLITVNDQIKAERRPSIKYLDPSAAKSDRNRNLSIPAKQVDKFLLKEKTKTENRNESMTWQQKLTSIKDVHHLRSQNDYEQFALNVLQEMDETYKPI